VEDAEKVKQENLAELNDRPDDLYRENIQISELNALNAALAMVKFKQVRASILKIRSNITDYLRFVIVQLLEPSKTNEIRAPRTKHYLRN